MENLCLFNPLGNSGRDGGHGKDHGGKPLVKSKQELVNEGNFVSDPSSGGEVLEVSDIFLEPIINDNIQAFEGLLGEFGEFKVSSSLGVKGEEHGVEVHDKLIEGLFSQRDC